MGRLTDMAAKVFTGKLRLYLEYALIALLLAVAGFATYNYTTRLKLDTKVTKLEGKVDKAEERVAQVEAINAQQATAIDTIRSIREVDGTILAGLATDMNALRVRDTSMTTRLATLERSNEAVRKYLNTAVPAPVGCLLDRTCIDQDGDGGAVPAKAADGKGGPASPRPK